MGNKYGEGHSMNNPDTGVNAAPGLRGLPGVLPKPKPRQKVTHNYGGNKIKMSQYYAGGGKVYTGRE